MAVSFNGKHLAKFIRPEEYEAIYPQVELAHKQLETKTGAGNDFLGWLDLPVTYDKEEFARIKEAAQKIRSDSDVLLVAGIGGSYLGARAVVEAVKGLYHNEADDGLKIYFCGNTISPTALNDIIKLTKGKRFSINVISKSGNTSETMSQYLIVSDLLKQRYGKAYGEHMILTTDASKGNLNKIGKADGLKMFVVPDGVGGRFSEMCPVGLLAAAVSGIDIEELLAGAAAMDARCRVPGYQKNPALFAAGAMYAALEKGLNIHVMMPYADSLKFMADWYAQLWAESLGKNVHRDGTPCDEAQTPVKSLGVTDQHSQVQLYTEGPDDKVITFLKVKNFRRSITIPVGCEEFKDVSFLCGKTLGELMEAECKSTEYALLKAAKPSWSITLPEVNAYTLGQLMYFFEMQTAYMGELMNVDAFNQPGVEEGKNAAYALLGRAGYENKAAELRACPAPDSKYVM